MLAQPYSNHDHISRSRRPFRAFTRIYEFGASTDMPSSVKSAPMRLSQSRPKNASTPYNLRPVTFNTTESQCDPLMENHPCMFHNHPALPSKPDTSNPYQGNEQEKTDGYHKSSKSAGRQRANAKRGRKRSEKIRNI